MNRLTFVSVGLVAGGAVLGLAPTAEADFRLRAVHASPDAGTVDVLANGGLFIPGFEYGTATDYVTLANGEYDVDLTPAGMMSPTFDLFGPQLLEDAGDVTLVAANLVSSLQPIVLFDDNTIDPENARVRIVHASPDAGNVSILSGGGELVPSLTFKNDSGYATLAPGSYDALQVRLNDGGGALVDLPTLDLQAGFVYTVFAIGLVDPAGGGEAFSVLTTVDIPSPGAAAVLAGAGLFGLRRRRAS
jgi:hypothetical protein